MGGRTERVVVYFTAEERDELEAQCSKWSEAYGGKPRSMSDHLRDAWRDASGMLKRELEWSRPAQADQVTGADLRALSEHFAVSLSWEPGHVEVSAVLGPIRSSLGFIDYIAGDDDLQPHAVRAARWKASQDLLAWVICDDWEDALSYLTRRS